METRALFNGAPKSFRANEFVSMEFDSPRMLVSPFLPTGGIGVLFGRGGTGKTQLALSLAAGIMDGGFFLSKYKCRRGKVGFVQVDTPPQEFQGRIQKLGERFPLDSLMLSMYDSPFDSVETATAAIRSKELPDWAVKMQEFGPDLVIVDSLRKVHRLDENDNSTPSRVFWAWRQLMGWKPTLLFLHHARKPIQGEFFGQDYDASRGAGAWTDDADVGMWFEKKSDSSRVLHWTKIRTCSDDLVRPLAVGFDPETLLIDIQDRVWARAVTLADVGLPAEQITARLVEENLCAKTKGYDVAKRAVEMVAGTREETPKG